MQSKICQRPEKQHKEKKEEHLKFKNFVESMRGPGTYPVNMSDFVAKSQPEQLQCFNSTQNRFGRNKEPVDRIGPTTYDPVVSESSKTRSNTATFKKKRTDNVFGIIDAPGPGDYNDRRHSQF